MLLLLTAHLSLNYAAVRSVNMHTLNRQRANILFSHLLAYDKILTPRDVAKRERVFEYDGALRWANDQVIAHGRVGASLEAIARSIASAGPQPSQTKSALVGADRLERLLEVFKDEDYIIWFDRAATNALIALKKGVRPSSQLKAWCQALYIAEEVSKLNDNSADAMLGAIAASAKVISRLFDDRRQDIIDVGWLLDTAALEVQSAGVRLVCMH